MIAKVIAQLIGLPRWAQALGGVALLIGAFLLWDWWDDRAAIADHEAKVTAAVATQSAAASEAAADVVAETKTELEKANADARNAAARSPDDPLRAGLDSLRAKEGPAKPASR